MKRKTCKLDEKKRNVGIKRSKGSRNKENMETKMKEYETESDNKKKTNKYQI